MTEGSISRKIIFFAIPLFIGNLFQQLYNTADSLIVGNFLGSNALAAVSSSGNLIFLMVGFINGIALGAGVVIARYYGAKNKEYLQKAIHTTVAFGLAAGLALTAIGMFLAPKILVLMGTPSEVLPQSIEYFRIYFAGSLGFVMYNIFVGILQSVGDSRHPLIYLIVSSCINVVLDIFFIAGLGMGVGAAALATAISQFASAIFCMIHLMRTKEEYRLQISKIGFDGLMMKQIIQNGVPSGFQNSVISIANVFVQTNINAFGKMAMAGCGSYSKIEGFAFLPVTCFTMALTTFVSQNLGAKQSTVRKKGARFGILCSIVIAELIGVLIYVAAPTLIAAFNGRSGGGTLWCDAGADDCAVLFFAGVFSLYRSSPSRLRSCSSSYDRHALCLVSVPCQLYYRCCALHSGYSCDLLGIPADLEHQLGDFPVSVSAWKMGIWIREKKIKQIVSSQVL